MEADIRHMKIYKILVLFVIIAFLVAAFIKNKQLKAESAKSANLIEVQTSNQLNQAPRI